MRLAWLLFSLIVLSVGVLLGIVYPKMMEKALGREIGRWTVYSGDDGFAGVETTMFPSDGATVVNVSLRTSAPLRAGAERELLLLTVLDDAGAQIRREPLGVSGPGALESPQTGVLLFHTPPVTLEPLAGRHRFVAEAGRDFADTVVEVDLTINAARYNVQPQARPVGLGLMALGGVVLLLSLRRRRGENPNSNPPPPKWGRR